MANTPIRTCVGCRSKDIQSQLLRVALGDEGRLEPDPRRERPGRGAWVHAQARCLELSLSRKAFERSFARVFRGRLRAERVLEFVVNNESAQ